MGRAGGYVLAKKGAELVLLSTGILPNGISNSVPEWKFVLGLDFTGRGTYSDKNLYILDIGDKAARRAATLDIIRNSWADCDHRLGFFLEKLRILWIRDEGSTWTALSGDYAVLPPLSLKRMDYYFHQLHLAMCVIMWLSGLLAVNKLRSDSKEGSRARLLAVILIGFFLVYLLIEVQPRYRCELMPLLAVISAAGFTKFERRETE